MFLMGILEKAGLVVASAQNVAPGSAAPAPAAVVIQTRVVSIKELVTPGPTHLAGPKGFIHGSGGRGGELW